MNKIVTILVATMFFMVSANYSQTSTNFINIGSLDVEAGSSVCVPVTVNDFNGIASLQFSLEWDESIIQFTGVQNLNLQDLNEGSFNSNLATSGQLALAWFDNTAQGITLTDGSTLFEICFTILGASGTASSIVFTDDPTTREAATPSGTITFTETNGSISVDGGVVSPPTDGGNTSPLISGVSSGSGDNGTTVCVNISVSNFTDITEMNYSLNWDAAVLQFNEIRNINLADLSQSSFGTTNTANGQLSINWTNVAGATANNGTIYQACFDLIGAAATSSTISFSDTPTPISVTTTASASSVGITQTNGSISVNSVAPPPVQTGTNLVNIATLTATADSTICVPVTVSDFNGIASLQFSMQWDPTVIQFTEVSNLNISDLATGNFNVTQAATGQLAMAWFDNTAQGVTVTDGATIFELCFNVIGVNGTSSNIAFTDVPTPREAANPNATITFTQTNGSVSVGEGTNPPPPPPTGGDALLNFPTLSAPTDSTICLPLTVNDFDAIASLQFSLTWDSTVLQFTEFKNFNLPDLSTGNFNTTQTASGQTALAWFDNTTQGVTLQDGASIFEMCFTVIGTTGETSSISFTDVPTPREAANPNTTITFTETNGLITVGEGTPPPPTGEDAIINIGDLTAPSGENVCVPITAKDFNDIAAMQFSLAWDPAVLSFTSTQSYGLPDLSAGGFNIDGAAQGQLAIAWFDQAAQGITLADDAVIFEVCFDVVGATGTSSTITFTDTPTARELAIATGTIDFSSSNGTITVGEGPPQPTGDGILNIAATNSPAGSSICIPVVVQDFTSLASMQFSLAWDPTVLQFTGVSETFGLPDLNAGSFNTVGAAQGQLAVAWFDQAAQGVTLADGTTIFELCFDVIGAEGATTTISFTDTPTTRELATANGTIDFTSSSDAFTVGQGPPPPDTFDNLVNIGTTNIISGAAFCVPVLVSDFDAIASLQFSLSWDSTVIEFTGVQNFGIADLTAAGFNIANTASGQLAMAWFDNSAQGVTLADNSTLFEICFNAVGNNGTSTTIAFTDTPTAREAATSNATINFTQTDGTINIGDGPPCAGPILPTTTTTNVSCFDLTDGAISLSASGGDGTYTYQWSDPSIGNTPNATGLAAGIYGVTISSCGGQEMNSNIPVASLTITTPSEMVSVITPENATCFGVADGRINVSVSGGSLPYTYDWSDPTLSPSNRPVNAAAGTYSLTITDASGCADVMEGIIVSSPTEIMANIDTTPSSCSGAADGAGSITGVAGGSGAGYTFAWGGGIEGANPTNLIAGNYTVTITDGNQCTTQIPVTITASITLSGKLQIIEDACGDGSGAIQITPSGGTDPYSYNWNGPVNIGDTNTVENIPTGTYTVTVTDTNGCFFVEDNIAVGGPTAILSASGNITNVDCVGENNGSIVLTAAGGFSPYDYSWSNDATTATIDNLTAGDYTVTVTDSKVCTYTQTFTVGTRSTLSVSVEVTQGAPDGSATATVTGGVMPYAFEWCNGQDSATATGLDEGICSLTIIDALGCTIVENVEINVNDPIPVISAAVAISCGSTTDGSLQVEATGGNSSYTYAWSNGATGSIISNVGAGTYDVTVTDAGGNTGTTSFEFTGPSPILITEVERTTSCNNDGRICISISGGTSPYKEIKWSNGPLDSLCLGGLSAGEYGVIITDQNDCTAEANFQIISDPSPECRECYVSNKVMTPNDDGRNDAFRIRCVGIAPNNHVEVYNRWGQLVFEADNYQCILGTESDCWLGRNRSENLVDEGGYLWVLEYDDTNGVRKRIRSHISILKEN